MKQFLLFTTLAISAIVSKAQNVTTFSGIQDENEGGYNSTPNNAYADEKYSAPYGIALDTNKKIYVTDHHNINVLDNGMSRIRGGFLGDPTGPDGIGYADGAGIVSRFFTPRGVIISKSTNKGFIVDSDNCLIRTINQFTNVSNTQIFGTLTGKKSFIGGYVDDILSKAEFATPDDIEIATDGTLYVSDFNNNAIRKITTTNVTTVAGGSFTGGDVDGIGTAAKFDSPLGIFLESNTSLLVADRNNGKIRRINLTTRAVTTVVSGLNSPTDVVVVDGILFIADDYCIKTWDGNQLTVFAGKAGDAGYANGSSTTARFRELAHLTYSKSDQSIFVCDKGNSVIRKVTIAINPIADFDANNLNPTLNQIVILRNKSKFANTLQWTITPNTYSLQNGSTLSDSVVYVSFASAGNYNVSLKASNGVGSDTKLRSSYINVSVLPSDPPVADFTVNLRSGDANLTQFNFVDLTSNNPTAWQWTFTPNNVNYVGGTTSASRFPKVTFTAAGTYTVALKATNANNNHTATKTSYITINTNSIFNVELNTASVYPNPASEKITVTAGNKMIKQVKILSATGKELVSIYNSNNTATIKTKELATGIYFVQAVTLDNQLFTSKLIIKK